MVRRGEKRKAEWKESEAAGRIVLIICKRKGEGCWCSACFLVYQTENEHIGLCHLILGGPFQLILLFMPHRHTRDVSMVIIIPIKLITKISHHSSIYT